MGKNAPIKLLQPNKRYKCIDTVIVITFYLTIVATVIVGVQLFIISLGLRLHTFIDMRLLEPYISTDSNILFGISIFLILFSILGLLSVIQYSHIGIIASIGLLAFLLGLTDVYAISDYRVKNYLSPVELYNLLYQSVINNPIDNMDLHLMQKRLTCCGINHYTDWLYILPFIPGSCCNNSTICDINDPSLYKDGCLQIVHKILSSTYQNTISVLTALNIVGVIAIFTGYFCSYLMRQLKKGGKILRTAIPRIQTYNAARSQQLGQIPNTPNNIPSVQIISGHSVPSAPSTIYPNLQSDRASNL